MGGQGGCERRIEVFVKIQKKIGGGVGLGGQGGCERRIGVFVKIKKKKNWGGVGGVGSGVGLGGQDGCERRIEVFGKIHKKLELMIMKHYAPPQMLVHKGGKIKNWGGECRYVTPTKSLSENIRVDVNREVKFL